MMHRKYKLYQILKTNIKCLHPPRIESGPCESNWIDMENQRRFPALFAMVRQTGVPTWFCSFSSADLRWPEKSNAMTAARMFDFRRQCLLNRCSTEPRGAKSQTTFIALKFQVRGSPHIHALLSGWWSLWRQVLDNFVINTSPVKSRLIQNCWNYLMCKNVVGAMQRPVLRKMQSTKRKEQYTADSTFPVQSQNAHLSPDRGPLKNWRENQILALKKLTGNLLKHSQT